MMNAILQQLGFDGYLIPATEVPSRYPDYADIVKIQADSVYFSAGKPAVLFLNVKSFDESAMRKIAQVQHNAWNYQRILLLYVLSDTEIRIFNCYEKPVNPNSDREDDKQLKPILLHSSSVKDDLALIEKLFSRINVDSGTLWTTDLKIRNRIKKDRRVDAFLIRSMVEAAKRLETKGLNHDVIHSLLIRSLFILFLEDKGAAKEAGLYESIKPGATSYFDVLKDKDATYHLFSKLQEQFNGNITTMVKDEESFVTAEHLAVVRDCFLDGDFSHQPRLFEREPLFNFEIIHIGLISEIYEHFLGEYKREKGQFYTPFSLADMILSEVLPTSQGASDYPLLDIACGSGIFLVEGYKRLIRRWKRNHQGRTITFEDLVSLLKDNIYGIEIDATAIRVAAFSLYLTLIDQLDPKTLWNSGNHRLPYLIYDPEDDTLEGRQGHNLWRRNTISEVDVNDFPKVKLLVGNPPYGTKNLAPEITDYCNRLHFAKEYVLPFMHKATQFCPDGDIALVFSSKVLFNTGGGYVKFRKWFFKENKVRRIDNLSIFRKAPVSYGGSLFSSASCPVCVAYFTAHPADRQDVLLYYSPKTFIKSNIIDALVIDESDVKILPMSDCQNPRSNILKVASWGNYYGFKLIERFSGRTLKQYFRNNGWITGRGLIADATALKFIPEKMIGTETITRYWTDLSIAKSNSIRKYRMPKDGLFDIPYVVFKQGQHKGEIACSLFTDKVYCTSTATVLNSASLDDKKILTAYLNSRLAKYFLLLTTSSWGIEREQITSVEVLNIPSPFEGLSDDARRVIIDCFDSLYSESSQAVHNTIEIHKMEEKAENEFEKALGLSKRDIIYVNDTLDYNFGIFQKGIDAEGYHRVIPEESRHYAVTFHAALSKLLRGTDLLTKVTVYDGSVNDPLQLIALDFATDREGIEVGLITDFADILRKIDSSLWTRHSESVYMHKTLKYYDGKRAYIIKPNQKRFWSRMQAYDDAASIVNDFLNL